MNDTREQNFKMIDTYLKQIAITKYMLINMEKTDESEVDDFINETGNKYMREIMKMSRRELAMYMLNDIIEKTRGE